MKSNKDFFRYIRGRRNMKETVSTLMNEMADLATTDIERADILSSVSASVFTSKRPNHTTQLTESKERDWENEILPSVGNQLKHLLGNVNER